MATPREPFHVPALADVAARGGLVLGRNGAGPCPLCNAERRGSADKRPPLAFFRGRDGVERWTCHACDTGGDAVSLLAAIRWREVPGRGDPRWPLLFDELRGESAAAPMGAYLDRVTRGHVAPRASRPSPNGPAAPPTRPVAPLAGPAPYDEAPAVPDEPEHHPRRTNEARELWAACTPLDKPGLWTSDPSPVWLTKRRGMTPERLAALDLARLVPRGRPLPRWLPLCGMDLETWIAVYRLAVPLYDARGELRALRFRAVPEHLTPNPSGTGLVWTPARGLRADTRTGRDGRERSALVYSTPEGPRELVKALSPAGSCAGLVMADPMALALLRHRGTSAVEVDGVRWSGRVTVIEGEPAWWAMATHPERLRAGADGAPETFATFGIEAGAWTPAIASRIPSAARVLVWTDHDDAGDRYYATVRDTLAGRVSVSRTARPSEWGTDGT